MFDTFRIQLCCTHVTLQLIHSYMLQPLEGYYEITVSLNIYSMNLQGFRKELL